MSEQKFPGRIWITNPDTDFLRMQNLGPQHEWLHLTEHQHILAEKDKRIERLREALRQIIVNAPDQSDPKNYNKYAFMACEALQEQQ